MLSFQRLGVALSLELGVAAVAEGRIGSVLASAQVDGFGFGGLELHGLEFASRVAAITEGLARAPAAGAPIVALAGFNGDGKWTFLCNLGF